MLIKYIKSVLWRVSKCLSYIEEARCLKVKEILLSHRLCSTEFLSRSVHISINITENNKTKFFSNRTTRARVWFTNP